MAAGYADHVDVQRRGASPDAFCWRGRVFRVQGVLAHWLETGPWWQSASVRGLLVGAGPGHGLRQAPAPAGAPGDREFWQVEAAAGTGETPDVYELCFDFTGGRVGQWSVTTVGAAAGHDPRGRAGQDLGEARQGTGGGQGKGGRRGAGGRQGTGGGAGDAGTEHA